MGFPHSRPSAPLRRPRPLAAPQRCMRAASGPATACASCTRSARAAAARRSVAGCIARPPGSPRRGNPLAVSPSPPPSAPCAPLAALAAHRSLLRREAKGELPLPPWNPPRGGARARASRRSAHPANQGNAGTNSVFFLLFSSLTRRVQMISTRQTGTAQLRIAPWAARLEFEKCAHKDRFAELLFTTPDILRARLEMPGKPAITTAQMIAALWCVIEEWGWPPKTGEKLPSRPL